MLKLGLKVSRSTVARLLRSLLIAAPGNKKGQRFKLLCPSSSKLWGKDLWWARFFVPIQAVDWCKCAEEAVIFVVDSGRKEQRICRARIRVVPERERP